MKKFAISLLAISMVVLLVFALNGGFEDAGGYNNISGYNEAAFSMPTSQSGATDSTSFLVGQFVGADGSRLSFDGVGNVKFTEATGIVRGGKYTLLQQADYSAMIQFSFDSGTELYSFAIINDKGNFVLGDADGASVEYQLTAN